MKNFYFDTESIGFFGPTVLLQYAIDDGDVVIHNLWTEKVGKSLELIEKMVECNVIGFNLSHDWFHISRTYNVLSMLPKNYKPEVIDYHDVEDEIEAHDKYCLKPASAFDLMLYGRNNEFQATMNQKPITIRRVPRQLAEVLIQELEDTVEIPGLYFAKRDGKQTWKIKDLHINTAKEVTPEEKKIIVDSINNNTEPEYIIDPDFVNIKLDFHPSTSLKSIMEYLLNKETDTIDDMLPFKKPIEYSWFPSSGEWFDVAEEHIWGWTNDQRRLKYAANDVHYLRDLVTWFSSKKSMDNIDFINKYSNDYNSVLACMVGALHWKGFAIDLDMIKQQLKEQEEIVKACKKEIEFDSPKKVVKYLHEACNPMEKELVVSSEIGILQACIEDGSDDLAKRARTVIKGRQARFEYSMLQKLDRARRLYVTFKVTGTKSNRMSGGSMEE